MAYEFVQCHPTAMPSPCALYVEVDGVEVGNRLTHFEPGHTEATPASCEQALTCMLPRFGGSIGFQRLDADVLTALAVISSRMEKRLIRERLVREVGQMDRCGPQLIPGFEYAEEVMALIELARDESMPLTVRIGFAQAILGGHLTSEAIQPYLIRYRQRIEDLVQHSLIKSLVSGFVALVISDRPSAPDLAYEYGGIVIHVNPAAPAVNRPKSTQIYRQIRVLRWNPTIPMSLDVLRREASLLEMGSSGWIADRWGVRSPDNHNSILTVRQVVTRVIFNRQLPINEEKSALNPYVKMTQADWDSIEDASKLRVQRVNS